MGVFTWYTHSLHEQKKSELLSKYFHLREAFWEEKFFQGKKNLITTLSQKSVIQLYINGENVLLRGSEKSVELEDFKKITSRIRGELFFAERKENRINIYWRENLHFQSGIVLVSLPEEDLPEVNNMWQSKFLLNIFSIATIAGGFLLLFSRFFVPLRRQLDRANQVIEVQLSSLQKSHSEMERQLEIARRVQEEVLALELPRIPNVEISHLYRPGKTLAGDFYDIFVLKDGSFGVFIADVAGNGVAASLITTMIKAFLMHESQHYRVPGKLLEALNNHLFGNAANKFVTAFYAYFDKSENRISYANAGHPYPLLITHDGFVRELEADGFMLGVEQGVSYATKETNLSEISKILFFTDGILHRRNSQGIHFGSERLKNSLADLGVYHGEVFLQSLIKKADEFAWRPNNSDDIAMIALEFSN